MAKTRKCGDEAEHVTEEFIESGAKHVTPEDMALVVRQAERIHQQAERKGPLRRLIREVETLLGMVRDYWRRAYREVPYYAISAAAFVLLYVLNPLDLIPDVLPGVGQLDDAAVLSICLGMIAKEIERYRVWKAAQPADAIDVTAEPKDK